MSDEVVILNGIHTLRYAYGAIQWPENHDLSACETPVCRRVTRPYYCLTDDGSLYVTTPSGTVCYLGPDTDRMTGVYPLNTKLTDQSEVPSLLDFLLCAATATSLTLCWPNPNEQGVNWEQLVRSTRGFLVPWRPGVAGCALSVGADAQRAATSYVIPQSDYFYNPKQPYSGAALAAYRPMELPYANGYYVIQDARDHCVVFYRGEVIYEGRFNGKGVPASFAYGVKYCASSEFCCPVTANLQWSYQMFPKWKLERAHYRAKSLWDQATEDMGVNERGMITVGNVVHSTRDDEGFDLLADEPAVTVLPFVVDNTHVEPDPESENEEEPEETLSTCPVYAGDCRDMTVLLAQLAERLTLKKALEDELSEEYEVLTRRLAALPLDDPTYDEQFALLAEKLSLLKRAQNEAESVERRIKAVELAQGAGGVQRGEFYGCVKVNEAGWIREYAPTEFPATNEILAELVGNRVLWDITKNRYWATPRVEEQRGTTLLGCDYDFLYTCTETEDRQTCENGAAPVHQKTWYEGTGYSVNASDSRFQLSQWKVECCQICAQLDADDCSPYKCGGGCGCEPPAQCGDCYPVTIAAEQEPLWGHLESVECDPSLAEKLLVEIPNFCDDSNNVYSDGEICLPSLGYCLPTYTARFIACGEGAVSQMSVKKTVQCKAEVATAKLEQLGGRIFPIFGSRNPLTNSREETNWAYIRRGTATCLDRKDYTIIGEISSPEELPGMVEFNKDDITASKIGRNAVNALILRAPHNKAMDTKTGFSPGFCRDGDSDEVKRVFTRFYPAYLTRPGFTIPLVNAAPSDFNEETGEYRDHFFDIHRGIFPPMPDEDTPNADGQIWHFEKFEQVENHWHAVWTLMITVANAIIKAAQNRTDKALENGESTPAGETTRSELLAYYKGYYRDYYFDELGLEETDLVPDWAEGYPLPDGEAEDGEEECEPICQSVLMPKPIQDSHIHESAATHGVVGKWYAQGPAHSEAEALNPVENAFDHSMSSGIYWKQEVNSWGDPEGEAIRTGLQVGDVFYCTGRLPNHSDSENTDAVPDDADRYWYWTGYQWRDGTTYFSEIDPKKPEEYVIFYKNKGRMDLRHESGTGPQVGDWDICTEAKALFSGKVGSLSACGELLAINLNSDSTYHKMLIHNDEILWERPAYGAHYTDTMGREMQEGMVCAGDTYVLAAYNAENNRQTFHLWMQEYADGSENREGRTTLVERTYTFSYEDMPDIFSVTPSWLTRDVIKKYGEKARKKYLILQSRSGKKCYVFYMGERIHTYTDGSRSASGTICGPRFAVIERPTSGHYDIWLDGVRKFTNIECTLHLGGAIIELPLWRTSDGTGGISRTVTVRKAIVVHGGMEYTWATVTENASGTFPTSKTLTCELSGSVVSKGDYSYYIIGNVTELFAGNTSSLENPVEGICSGTEERHYWRASYDGLLWNSATESLVPSVAPKLEYPEWQGSCANGVEITGVGNKECRYFSSWRYSYFTIYAVNFKPSYYYTDGPGGSHTYAASAIGCGGEHFALTGLIYQQHVTMQAGTGATPISYDEMLSAIGAVAIWDDGTVQTYDWHACGTDIDTCQDEWAAWPDKLFTACSLSPASCGLSYNRSQPKALIVYEDGGATTGQLPNPCGCTDVSSCGRYSQWRQQDNSYKTYYTTDLLPETEKIVWCCGSGSTEYGNYALFPNGNLYYGSRQVDVVHGCEKHTCCGDGLLLIDGAGNQRFYVGGVITAVYEGASGDFTLTCCGIDYYLLQRGEFDKIRPEVTLTKREYSNINEPGVTYHEETCALGQRLLLDDGTVATLCEVTVIEGRTYGILLYDVYRYERPAKWQITLPDSSGTPVTTYFDHDVTYAFPTEELDGGTYIADDELVETRSGYVPWKYTYKRTGREVHVFYKKTEISHDPRITELSCFRLHNTQVEEATPEYHAEAAYAIFYDDPWNDLKQDQQYQWSTGGGDMLTPRVEHLKWVREQSTVKDVLPLFDPIFGVEKTIWNTPCDCEIKAKIKNSHPNVCLIVWEKEVCTSGMNHDNDQPMIPFCETFAASHEIADFRREVIYINDYNAAVRWDRLTADDPVDAWQNGYFADAAGTGGFWLSAPACNHDSDHKNKPYDGTGRLVASGNMSVFVWDKEYGRLEFNALTGNRVVRGVDWS